MGRVDTVTERERVTDSVAEGVLGGVPATPAALEELDTVAVGEETRVVGRVDTVTERVETRVVGCALLLLVLVTVTVLDGVEVCAAAPAALVATSRARRAEKEDWGAKAARARRRDWAAMGARRWLSCPQTWGAGADAGGVAWRPPRCLPAPLPPAGAPARLRAAREGAELHPLQAGRGLAAPPLAAGQQGAGAALRAAGQAAAGRAAAARQGPARAGRRLASQPGHAATLEHRAGEREGWGWGAALLRVARPASLRSWGRPGGRGGERLRRRAESSRRGE